MLRKILFLLFSVVIINTCHAASNSSDLPSTRGVTSNIIDFFKKCLKKPLEQFTQHANPQEESPKEQADTQTETVFIPNADEYPAHHYAREGDLEQLKLLGTKNADDLLTLDDQGNTPLHHAAQHNRLEVVQYLLAQYGKNIEKGFGFIIDLIMKKNNKGKTASALAADAGHRKVFIKIANESLYFAKLNSLIDNVMDKVLYQSE